MPRDSMQFSSMSTSFVLGALLSLAVASPTSATGQASPPKRSTIKPSSTQKAAHPLSNPKQNAFSSPQQAARSLYDAAHNHDDNAILTILGPGARDIVIWTDNSAERNAQDDVFTEKYEQMNRLVKEPDNEITLYVGAENWPMPIPIVGRDGAWYFDSTSAGAKSYIGASVKMKWTLLTPSTESWTLRISFSQTTPNLPNTSTVPRIIVMGSSHRETIKMTIFLGQISQRQNLIAPITPRFTATTS